MLKRGLVCVTLCLFLSLGAFSAHAMTGGEVLARVDGWQARALFGEAQGGAGQRSVFKAQTARYRSG